MTLAAFARPRWIVRETLERFDLLIDCGDAEIELADDLARDALRGVAAFELVLQNDKALADIGERRALFEQAHLEGECPGNVGAAVEVVADP